MQWWWALVIIAGSLLAMMYVFRVMSHFFVIPVDYSFEKREPGSRLLEWPALFLALISLFLGLAASWPLRILSESSTAIAQLFPGGLP